MPAFADPRLRLLLSAGHVTSPLTRYISSSSDLPSHLIIACSPSSKTKGARKCSCLPPLSVSKNAIDALQCLPSSAQSLTQVNECLALLLLLSERSTPDLCLRLSASKTGFQEGMTEELSLSFIMLPCRSKSTHQLAYVLCLCLHPRWQTISNCPVLAPLGNEVETGQCLALPFSRGCLDI